MKRFLSLMAAMVMVMAAMAQNAGIVLSYNKGKELKFFKSNQIAEAIDEAEVNDTIYFGPGSFSLDGLPDYEFRTSSYDREIAKPLVFIGAGMHSEGTRFSGHTIYLKVDPSLSDSQKVFSFEGIRFSDNNNIRPASDLTEVKFVNSRGNFVDENDCTDEDNQFVIDNLFFDGCEFYNITLDRFSTKRVDIKNTKVNGSLNGGADSAYGVATLDHCYVYSLDSKFVGLVEHSLISYVYGTNETVLRDSYYSSYSSNYGSTLEECNFVSSPSSVDNEPSSLGNCKDGTYYGTMGGVRPFSYYPPYPTPDSSVDSETNKANSFVDYDSDNKKLTITVKRLGE